MSRVPTKRNRDSFAASAERLLRSATDPAFRNSLPTSDVQSFVSRALPSERQLYVLEERNAELELQVREWEAARQLYELEFRALEIASRLNVGYVAHLEARQDVLQEHQDVLQEQLAHEAGVRGDLLVEINRLRAEVAEISARLHAVQSRRAYRFVNKAVPIVRKVLAPPLAVRRWIRRKLSGHRP